MTEGCSPGLFEPRAPLHPPSEAMQFVDQLDHIGVQRADKMQTFLQHARKRTRIAAPISMPRRPGWYRVRGLNPCESHPHRKIASASRRSKFFSFFGA